MLVTQCPRCHESVCVPDALLAGGGTTPDSAARAQCPWCLETLDSSELRGVLPPALVLVGEQAVLSSGDTPNDDWAGINQDASALRTSHESAPDRTENHFRDADISLEDHAAHTQPFESEVSELDSVEIDPAHEEDDSELAFQQPVSSTPVTTGGASASLPQRIIKISVPGKSGAGADKSAAMMYIDPSQSRRRSKKSSPLKTMIGVALGGLLALPIVGIILHYATGQYVPYISDILPGGGSTRTQTRTSAPMPIDDSDPRLAQQPSQTSLEGQSIGDEIPDVTTFGERPDPADAALQAITGEPTNSNTVSSAEDSTQPTPGAPENHGALPDSTAPVAEMPAATAPDAPAPEDSLPSANVADSGSPDARTIDDNLADIVVPDNVIPENSLPDSVLPDSVLPDSVLPNSTATEGEAESTNQADAATGNANPMDATPSVAESTSPTAPNMNTNADTDDLFGGTSEILFPAPVAPESPAIQPPSMDVDAEIAQLSDSIDQISALPADAPKRGELIQQLYESLSRLAGEVPAKSAAKLSPLLDEMASNTSLVIAFAKATPGWVNRTASDRGGDGAVVVGKMSGDAADATFTLLGGQELPVTLPPSVSTVPAGFQVGLGRVTGSGPDAVLTLDLLQSIKQ